MAVTLYQSAECHECGLVRRVLRGNAVPFDVVTMPAGDKSIVRQKFGSESVPVLVDGEFVSNDVRVICKHIESRYKLVDATL